MKYQAYFPRFRQDIADLLSDVEKSLSVGVWCNLQDKFYVICEISAQHPLSYKRCQGLEGTVPLSTRPTWSGWTSGTTSSSATWAGGALTNPSKIQTQVLIDHPGNFFIFFRVDTLLRHAHFSIQSRRLWKQFDSEVRRLLNLFLLVQQENNGFHSLTKSIFTWAFEQKALKLSERIGGELGWTARWLARLILLWSKSKWFLWPFLSTVFVSKTTSVQYLQQFMFLCSVSTLGHWH